MNVRFSFVVLLSLIAAVLAPAAQAAAAPLLTPKEIAQGFRSGVVLAKPHATSRGRIDSAEAADAVKVRETFPRLGDLRVIELNGDEPVATAVTRLQATGRYEFVEPDYIMHADAVPNDTYFSGQWALNNTGQKTGYTAGDDIDAVPAWDIIHDAPNVVVAVIDGGVRVDHQDIAGNLWQNPSPTIGDIHGLSILGGVRTADINDVAGHGTHVAGIIAASGNNGVGTCGVAWRTQLMILKNSQPDGTSVSSDSAACVDYAIAHGANIINCSFGGNSYSNTFYTALKAARNAGVIVVCAAGNDGVSNDYTHHYPSDFLLDNILSVGNSTPADAANTGSNYGAIVDLFAPGTSIYSADWQSTTGALSMTGTSMASPHVAGALALVKARFPNETYRESMNRLLSGVDMKTAFAGRAVTNGRLNLLNALTTSTYGPFNDNFSHRAIIAGDNLVLRSNNADATNEYGEPAHAASGSRSIWWHWVPSTSGPVVIETAGSEFDTALDVYTAPSTYPTLSSLVSVASNDDFGGATTSRVQLNVTAGTYYYIAVSGKNGAGGYVQLHIAPAVANDNFANAAVLSGQSAQATANNSTAGTEPGEPTILGNTAIASLWYQWTAPRSGRFQVSAYGYSSDMLLAIYTGTSLSQLSLVAASDDTDLTSTIKCTDSRCTINAASGTTYYFQVAAKSSSNLGDVVTTVTDSKWQLTNGMATFTASPAIGPDGTLYIGSSSPDDRLYAVRPDGTLKWTYALQGSLNMASPAVGTDGVIYQGDMDGMFVALESDGSVRWTHDFGSKNGFYSTPSIAKDGTIYIHPIDGRVYALDPITGATKWSFDAGAVGTYGGAAIAPDGTLYQVSDANKCIYAINPDGTQKWKYALNSDTYSTPSLDAAGNVYFTTYTTPAVYSLTPAGALRWSFTAASSDLISGSVTLNASGDTAYVGTNLKKLYAINTALGEARWSYTCGDSILACTAAVDANGVIYIGAYDGKLYAINSDGTLKRTWDTALMIRSSPVISGGTLYVGSNDGKLYAFDIGANLADGPWSEFRNNAQRTGRTAKDALAVVVGPQGATLAVGDSTVLHVIATGQGLLTYQWQKDGVDISGATSSSYKVTVGSASTAGNYTVKVTGSQGTVTSTAAAIAVLGVDEPGHLINLSIRSNIGTGDQSLNVGFTVAGGTAGAKKPLLIRAAGPSLSKFYVDGRAPDPTLRLVQQQVTLMTNDGWKDDAEIATVGDKVGAFPFLAGSLDAALSTQLTESPYSVVIGGKTAGGVVLVEVYDASGGYSASTPRLINISARTQVGTGGDVLIAGFTVGGSTKRRLLIRGVGPSMSKWNVGGLLADPKLELTTGDSALITQNDNWNDDPAIVAASNATNAFPLDPGSKDAALIVELDPGKRYSAVVKGVGDTTGVALVEVYELP